MNNEVTIIGIAKDENCVEAARPSGIMDQIPVLVPKELVGKRISLKGELLSTNTYDRKLKLCVYPSEAETSTQPDENKSILRDSFVNPPIIGLLRQGDILLIY